MWSIPRLQVAYRSVGKFPPRAARLEGEKSASQIILGIEQSSDKMNRAKVRIKLNREASSGARDDKVVGGGSFFSCGAMLDKAGQGKNKGTKPLEEKRRKNRNQEPEICWGKVRTIRACCND